MGSSRICRDAQLRQRNTPADARRRCRAALVSEGRQHGRFPHEGRAPCLAPDPWSHHRRSGEQIRKLMNMLTCVWVMTRMTWQYFFIKAKSFSSCFLPSSSCHFLQYLVKAFFLDLYLLACSIGRGNGWHRSFIARGQRKDAVHGCSSSSWCTQGGHVSQEVLAHGAVSKKHFPLARGARSSSGHAAPERSCQRPPRH